MDKMQEFKDLVGALRDTVEAKSRETSDQLGNLTAEQQERLEKINNRMDELEFDLQKQAKASKAPARSYEHLDTFKTAFERWANGDRSSLKSMELKSGYHRMTEHKNDNLVRFDFASAGALLLPEEMSMDMLRDLKETSPIMQLVTVSQTNAPQRKRTLRVSTPGIQWLEETEELSKVKPVYRTVTLTPHKVGAGYGFSIEQFQDSAWDIPGELSMAYREDFEVGVATACVKGNGIGKPTGFIDKVSGMNSGAVALTTNMLIRLQENLLEQYQRNASWLFNRKTRAYIRSLVLSATNGLQYTWEPDFQRGAPTLLLGDPIYIAADGDLAGLVTGNFTAGDRPIVYGDFKRGYEVTMHTDMYIIDDPYSESNAFVRNINIMSRVDGKPLEADKALVALHITTS